VLIHEAADLGYLREQGTGAAKMGRMADPHPTPVMPAQSPRSLS
jgi:hypothetical protein